MKRKYNRREFLGLPYLYLTFKNIYKINMDFLRELTIIKGN